MKDLNSMELKISRFLRIGVIISGFIILVGWIMSFQYESDPFTPLQVYSPLSLVQSIFVQAMLENWGKIIIYLGLSLLISLPVLRVFFSIILLLRQKEKTMALVGAMVLLGLILSFALGL